MLFLQLCLPSHTVTFLTNESACNPTTTDRCFEKVTDVKPNRELLFRTCLMARVSVEDQLPSSNIQVKFLGNVRSLSRTIKNDTMQLFLPYKRCLQSQLSLFSLLVILVYTSFDRVNFAFPFKHHDKTLWFSPSVPSWHHGMLSECYWARLQCIAAVNNLLCSRWLFNVSRDLCRNAKSRHIRRIQKCRS